MAVLEPLVLGCTLKAVSALSGARNLDAGVATKTTALAASHGSLPTTDTRAG